MTDEHHRHIGIQIWTTNALHTMAYQVIPIILNRNIFDPNELPPDYRVSRHDLYIGDILFDPHPPTIGQPTADEDEVLRAPPPYPERYHRVNPLKGQPNRHRVIRPGPFGLPNGPRGRCPGRISDAEVNSVRSRALYPEIILGDTRDEPIGSGPSRGNLYIINHSETRTNPLPRLPQTRQNERHSQPAQREPSGVRSLDPPRQATACAAETRSVVERLPQHPL